MRTSATLPGPGPSAINLRPSRPTLVHAGLHQNVLVRRPVGSNEVRVIGGRLGGRRLVAAQGTTTRPTADRVREALFSRLESRYGLSDARVLDVFAGTGALAIEAVSRGAAGALCIESGKSALAALRRNVSALALERSVRVLAGDFRSALRAQAQAGATFDGVFVDAPYAKDLTRETLELLDAGALVAERGWVAAETSTREKPLPRVGRLVLQRQDAYGDTMLLLYERSGDATGEDARAGGIRTEAQEPQPTDVPEPKEKG